MYKKTTNAWGISGCCQKIDIQQMILIMRLIALLILIPLLHVSASTNAQQITLSVKNKKLNEVFEQIRLQSGYDFIFTDQALKNAQTVSIQVKDAPLSVVLEQIFKGQPLNYSIGDRSVVVKTLLVLAFSEVRGQVVDSLGKALSGATVRAFDAGGRRTTLATTTDKDGGFVLENVPEDGFLEITYIGFITQRLAAKANMSQIVLIAVPAALKEVEVMVNTGYQTLKPNEVNGSVTVIDEKMLQKQTSSNILGRLEGITNGLTFQVGRDNYNNPQNKTNITIRGYSTINGPLDPLIVLDNFVYEGNMENINPNDIESVTILKDAEATSIYGARGGNGVIVLTTKRVKMNEPMRVSGNFNTTITEKPNLFASPQMRNEDYIAVEEFLFENKYFDRDLTRTTFPPLTPIVYLLAQKRKEAITEEEYSRQKAFLTKSDFKKQYTDYFYKNAVTSQYHVGITGGGSRTSQALGVGHNSMKDQYGKRSNKSNVRLSFDAKVSSRIKLSIAGMYTNSFAKSGQIPSFSDLSKIGTRQSVPYLSLFDEQGEETAFYKYYNPMLIDTIGKGRLLDWHYYPYSDPQFTDFKSKLSELLGNVVVDVKILDGLGFTAYYQIQGQNMNRENLYEQKSYYTRNYINQFSEINESTGEVTYNFPIGNILGKSITSVNSQSLRTQLNYSKRHGSHHILAMFGMEARESKSSGESWTHLGYRRDPLGYLPGDFINLYTTLPLGGYDYMPGAPILDPTLINRFTSLYSNFNYMFLDRYSLSGSIRRDGSNIYGVSTNDKWKPLWSIGMGYDLTKERFLKDLSLDKLRLKATYGYSGNVDLSRSALPIATFGNNPVNVGGLPSAIINTPNNPLLRWEQVRQINFGVDFGVNRWGLDATIEYYQKNGTDLYGPTDYDYTTTGGSKTIVMNVASMRGEGVDILLRHSWRRANFSWTNMVIYNYNQSKTKEYYDDSGKSDLARVIVQNGKMITPIEGFPLYSLAAYTWGGLDDKGNPQGYLDGELSTNYNAMSNADVRGSGYLETIKFMGSAIPTSFGSWQQELRYKAFTLSFALVYKAGYYFRKPSINYNSLIAYGFGHPDYEVRWQNPGDNTDVPSFEYPLKMSGRDNFYMGSEALARNASNIRLKFVNFSYDLKRLGKVGFLHNAEVYANVNNIALLWVANKEGLDPDYVGSIPPQRTWSIGFRTSF